MLRDQDISYKLKIPYFGQNMTFQSAGVTLKIRSRSLKPNQQSFLLTMYLCEFDQNTSTDSVDNAQKPHFGTFQNATVALKNKSRSPNSNVLFSFSQQFKFTRLLKIH